MFFKVILHKSMLSLNSTMYALLTISDLCEFIDNINIWYCACTFNPYVDIGEITTVVYLVIGEFTAAPKLYCSGQG